MIQAGKYKVSNLAKDLNMKTKEVTDILSSCGFTGKTHSSVLSEDEFAAVITKVTEKAQIVGINDYIDSKAFLPTEFVSQYAKADEKPQPKAEEKVEIKTILPLTICFDHRALDFGEVAPFIRKLEEIFNNPEIILGE